MSKPLIARVAALLATAAATATALVGVASPAQAAPLGTVNLSQSSGSVSDSPMFASGTTSAACPSGYGDNVALRIGRPEGPFSNLRAALGAGGYDTAPVTIEPNRSFATALGGVAPGSGEWWVVVECFSATLGQHPDRFVTSITVTGSTWELPPAPVVHLGTVTLSQSTGLVSDTPVFASGTTSAACPSGYGDNVALRVGRPEGPFSNLRAALGAGGYDTAPVTIEPNRSFTTALGGVAPGEGEWWVVVECFSATQGQHPDRFVTPIIVAGDTWTVSA
ncbi:hypothetical protein ACTMTJ_26200 [Phytohabitans sp. LJ34]|uniref:hypothetical protein n=1 Tax=Phytohabitans sp. LJ34 TaxID=3452217 RepID=UPI003F8BCC8E